jgi:hypothetical protein
MKRCKVWVGAKIRFGFRFRRVSDERLDYRIGQFGQLAFRLANPLAAETIDDAWRAD